MNKSVSTVLFMILISVVFIAALAVVNETALPQITRNVEMQELKSVLYAFGMLPEEMEEHRIGPTMTTADLPWQEDRIMEKRSQIEKLRLPVTNPQKMLLKDSFLSVGDSVTVWTNTDTAGQVRSYGFAVRGKGLWGTISAFAVISSDLKTMIGIDFTEQVETPGLGARITEEEFKSFFRNLDLSRFHDPEPDPECITMVREKTATNREKQTHELQAITGATQTCDGVLKMLNTDLMFYIQVIQPYSQH